MEKSYRVDTDLVQDIDQQNLKVLLSELESIGCMVYEFVTPSREPIEPPEVR